MTILTQHKVRKSNLFSYDTQPLDTLYAVELLDGKYQREKGVERCGLCLIKAAMRHLLAGSEGNSKTPQSLHSVCTRFEPGVTRTQVRSVNT